MIVKKINLNLGAGNKIEDPKTWVNHDIVKHRDEISVVWDLNQLPWPWENETFTMISAKAVFEHLDIDLLKSVNECWRILKPGGKLYFKVPNAEDVVGCWGDPTHRRPYTFSLISIFDYKSVNDGNNFYTDRKWKIVRKGVAGSKNKQGIWSSIYVEMEKFRR